MPGKPILETERLFLRELVAEDADALARVLSDPEAMRYYPMSFDRKAVEDWIARNQRRYATDGHGLWAMDSKFSGEVIGDCGITLQEVEGESLPEVGYHLRRDMWGQGLASEAACACRDYGFRQFKVAALISLIRPENMTFVARGGEKRNEGLEGNDTRGTAAPGVSDSEGRVGGPLPSISYCHSERSEVSAAPSPHQ